MAGFLKWLFGPPEPAGPRPDMLIVDPGADRVGGTCRSIPRAYVDFRGKVPVVNTSLEMVEIVHIDLRRTGAVGDSSNVRAVYTPQEIPPGTHADVCFSVSASPVFETTGPFVLADVIMWDADGRRHRFRQVKFRSADEQAGTVATG